MAKAIPVHPDSVGNDPAVEAATETPVVAVKGIPKLVPVPTPEGEQPKVASPFHREDY